MKKFYKKVNKSNNKEMYEFLHNHFRYWTCNSWNKMSSIANNMKLYNLGLSNWEKALEMLEIDDWFDISIMIEDFNYSLEDEFNCSVGVNGRSGGYLVLYNKNNSKNVLPTNIADSQDYEEFKEWLKYDGYTLKDYHDELIYYTELVQSFDKFCDDIIEAIQYMIDNAKVKEEEYTEVRTRKYLEYESGV